MDSSRFPASRVGVIGCGHWGKNLIRNFAELRALAAVSDTDLSVTEHFAAKYQVPGLGVDQVLTSPDLDAVAIAAPAEHHARLALMAIESGKHVFVEKPIALSEADAQLVVDAATHRGVTLMVGHLLQYHPCFHKLQQVVRDGTLGRLQYIYSNRLNLGTIRRGENAFWDLAPHDISMILSIVGEDPVSVFATDHAFLHNRISEMTVSTLEFPDGIAGHLFVSRLHPFKEQKLIVVGEAGMLVFDDCESWDAKLQLYRHRIAWNANMPLPVEAEAELIAVDQSEPLKLECRHFLDCVMTGRRPRTDGAEAMRVLRVLSAATRSVQSGGPVYTDARRKTNEAPKADCMVHETAVVDDDVEIGPKSTIWHFCHILSGSRIGEDVVIGQNGMIGPDVVVGDNCKIQNNVSLYKGVTLEADVFCGPSCVFTNVLTPRANVNRKDEFAPTLVRRGATIGANATIVCGNTLGEYCMVAAGAVVTSDVPPHALVAGLPARQIGWVSHAGERLGDDLVCPRSGQRYQERDGRLCEISPEKAQMVSHEQAQIAEIQG